MSGISFCRPAKPASSSCQWRDLGFAQPPAQVDLAAVHPAGEIDQAGEVILQLDAELGQLALVLVHLFLAALELGLDLAQFLVGGRR